jgi:hypothetical protein
MDLGPLEEVTDYWSIAGCCGVGNPPEVMWTAAVKNDYPLDSVVYLNGDRD